MSRACLLGIVLPVFLAGTGLAKNAERGISCAVVTMRGGTTFVACDEFTEDDTIYVQVGLAGARDGKHKLEVLWFRPGGILQDRASQKISVRKGKALAAFLLKFHPSEPEDPGLFPEPGRPETWEVHAKLTGKVLGKRKFTIWRR